MASTTIDVDASELDDARDNILRLAKNLATDERELQSEEPEKMRQKILTSIKRNFEDTRTDPDGTSLLDAFYIDTGGAAGKRITTQGTGAEHAKPLEDGISPHTIEGNPHLAFQPENPGDYPASAQAGGGYVVLDKVEWKPDKAQTAKGYKYVLEAQRMWDADIKRSLPQRIRASILDARYKPSQ